MESDGEPYSQYLITLLLDSGSGEVGSLLLQVIVLLGLLIASALISGSEVAFFSLRGESLYEVKSSESTIDKTIVRLLNRPKRLLATILITNNVVNISIIILSTSVTSGLLQIENEILSFAIQVLAVTFLLVLFGEVTPKIYAQYRSISLARLMARPMALLAKLFLPGSWILVGTSSFFEKRILRYQSELSREELNEAIELTSDDETSPEEKNILKGIVNFGDIMVRQIMKPRQAVIAYPNTLPFEELKQQINEHRFSRLPIYEGDIDKVIGILHVKDLLPYLGKGDDFDWVSLTRKPYFVPEMKQIDDLLNDFQAKKIHMAVVVDEYGGTEGVVTMEDVLEEIVGEIHDEFDDTEVFYSKLDDHVVVFDGKTSLSDVQKVMKLEPETFEEYKTLVDSIGGLATEVHGKIPQTGELIQIQDFDLKIELADRKRVKRIKITHLQESQED